MLCKRIIVCLDVDGGRVVKGVRFRDLRDVGDPATLAVRYEQEGADEIVFLDISASSDGRRTLLDVVRRTAERLFIPLTVGGGIRTVSDISDVLRAGADKVSLNTAAVRTPGLIAEGAARFGCQCMVVSIDAADSRAEGTGAPNAGPGLRYEARTHGGRNATGLDAIEWAVRCAQLGAGEILLTAIDRDGRRDGYDIELTSAVSRSVTVPVIASGGAGSVAHFREALTTGGAAAALAAGIFHDRAMTVGEVKDGLAAAGVAVRPIPIATEAA